MFPQGPNFRKLEIPKGLDTELVKSLIKKEHNVFIMKFIISLLALLFGVLLINKGIGSESTIKFVFKGLSLELNKAYPGVTLAFIGLILMLFSRINIKIKG